MSEQHTSFPLNRALAELPAGSLSAADTATGTDVLNNIDVPTDDPSRSGKAAASGGNAAAKFLDAAKWAFSFPAMLAMCLVGRVFYEARNFFVDPDLWWHIKVGQDLLRTHHFPTTDTYSWTVAGHSWIAYEWLGEVALALVNRAGGVMALSAILFVLSSIIMLTIYALATVRAKNSKAGFVSALILCSLAFGSFTMRPQMFGYLFLVLTLLVMEKFRQGVTWPLWTLPAIFLAWVNIHGSFIIGIGVIVLTLLSGLFSFSKGSVEAVAWTREQRIKLETCLLLCIAVLPITPYGTQLAVYPFDMAFSQPINVASVNEWRPMPFELVGGKIFLGIIVIMFLLQVFFQFKWRVEELALAVGGAAMACLHVRFILLFVPFFAPVFAFALARWIPAYKKSIDKFALNAILMAAAAVAIFHYWPTQKKLDEVVSKASPVGALQYLANHPQPGKMLNSYGFGGYLVKSGIPTFIDGRGDLFERGGVFADYAHLTQFKPGAFGILRNYDISVCLLERDEPLSTALLESAAWRRVYVDKTSAIFVRQSAPQ
jgi:hypothetical protein